MSPKEFKEVNIRIAENQEEFVTLPAFYNEQEGSITFCFALNKDELNRIKATEEIWFKMLTGGKAMHPISLTVNKEDLIEGAEPIFDLNKKGLRVKMLIGPDGEKIKFEDRKWCAVKTETEKRKNVLLCDKTEYEEGEIGKEYRLRSVENGVTCKKCLEIIKELNS